VLSKKDYRVEINDLNKLFLILILLVIPISFNFAEEPFLEIPHRFGKITLGMTMESTEKELERDGNFYYRGSPDISILQRPNESLIECRGYDFVERAFFQFKENKLYSITILLNQELLDHYSLYTTLSGKYGEPAELNPEKSKWISDKNILVLERPLQIKYLDREIFEGITNDSKISKSHSELSQVQFLEQF
jgi:hypothetical protein